MPNSINNSGRVNEAIRFALAQVGKPYVWASAGPNSYDCSGLIWRAYEKAGYRFQGRPTTYTLVGMGRAVERSEIQPGDLIFQNPGHVTMALSNSEQVGADNPRVGVRRSPIIFPVWRIRRLIENGLSNDPTAPPVDGSTPDPPGTSTGSQAEAPLEAIDSALSALNNPETWIRFLYVVLGIICCLIAAARMSSNKAGVIVDAATTVAKAKGKP